MAKLKKNPSKAGISAASVTGNAGPTDRGVEKDVKVITNNIRSIIWAKNNAIYFGQRTWHNG